MPSSVHTSKKRYEVQRKFRNGTTREYRGAPVPKCKHSNAKAATLKRNVRRRRAKKQLKKNGVAPNGLPSQKKLAEAGAKRRDRS